MSGVTVLIPVLRSQKNEQWLQECVTGFPQGTKYLVIENDGDLAGALNQALEQVTTEWVMPFGHDDVPDDHMVDQLLAAGHDADVVYPSMVLTDIDLHEQGVFNADIFCGNRLQTWNYVPGGFIARTATVRKAGGWRDLDALEDWDLHVRMYRTGARFKACPEARFLYRQVPGSRNKTAGEFENAQAMRHHYQELIVGTVPEVKATFYYQATPAVAYWRCIIPARHLPGVATSAVSLEAAQRPTGEIDFLDQQGAAVFQFAGDKGLAASALLMQAAGTKTLIEVDDNYLDEQDYLFRKRAGWGQKIVDKSAHSVQGHKWIVENVDGVIVTTKKLAEIYGQANDNIYICRNSLDLDDWPEYVKLDDGVFRIGWFASLSHDRDAPLIRRALSWASRQPNVQVITCGLDPAGWDFDRIHIPWSDDLAVYRQALLALDVGVAPILRTASSVCRSDLKALEFGVSGVLPILQSLDPYDEWRDKPALMASTAKDFEEQIRWCVKHQDEAREMAQQARNYVIGNRTIQHEIGRWSEAVGD